MTNTDDDWYSLHRRRVEAAHAAAKQAKREAECRNCRDGFPAYAAWPDWRVCPMCGRNCDAAAKDDEAAKRKVADMMDGIRSAGEGVR